MRTNSPASRLGPLQPTKGRFTGPLILSQNPVVPLEAVSKQYMDNVVSALNATNIVSGVLDSARLPAFTGNDVISTVGTSVLGLVDTGVVAGQYKKVTVSDKGRVTASGTLTEGDIPSFSWSKIDSGKPSTLDGYEISDAIPLSGTTLSGSMSVNGGATQALHAVTKSYVDGIVTSFVDYVPGDIMKKINDSIPTGFLRINGASISKTTYANLYSVIGETFTDTRVQAGNGQPWKHQYDINLTQSGDITGWTTGTSLPGTLINSSVLVTKNRVYLIGGILNSTASSAVYTTSINADGTLETWVASTSLPVTIHDTQIIVTKNRVYLLSGVINGVTSSAVYTATINADGTLGSWTTGTSLPATFSGSNNIVTRNRVYLLTGYINGTVSSSVYTASINNDGTLGSWTTGTSLPASIRNSQVIATKNRVYLIGGVDGNGNNNTYSATINADGTLGTWAIGTKLPAVSYNLLTMVTRNTVYILGGRTGSGTQLSTVRSADIDQNGILGAWTTRTSMPGGIDGSQVIVTKNYIYILGGATNGALNVSTVYRGSISSGLNDYSAYYDGTITTTPSDIFVLPNYSSKETANKFYFIKY